MSARKRTWAKIRRIVLERDDHTCRYCGDRATHVDHIIPRSAGGPDYLWNLIAACEFCNCSKGAKVLDWAVAWRTRVEHADADADAAYEAARAVDVREQWDDHDDAIAEARALGQTVSYPRGTD